jgi:hypothetical protein
MKRALPIALLNLLLLLHAFANGDQETQPGKIPTASKPGFGLGIVLGEPTGITAKLFLHPLVAFDLGLAWSFAGTGNTSFDFVAYGDYLFHFFGLIPVPVGDLGFYCGIGGLADIQSSAVLVMLRIPLGATYLFAKVPLDVFLEIVPSMEIFPKTAVVGFGGVGIRYWFK